MQSRPNQPVGHVNGEQMRLLIRLQVKYQTGRLPQVRRDPPQDPVAQSRRFACCKVTAYEALHTREQSGGLVTVPTCLSPTYRGF
jgi:hypothetical protein